MFKGTVIAQSIGFIGILVLAKLYGANAFGLFGIYVSVCSILTVLYTLQLEHGIITSKNKDDANKLYAYILLIAPIITLICFLIFGLVYQKFNFLTVHYIVIFIGITISLFTTLNKLNEAYFTRGNKFKIIANAKILLTLISVSFQLLLFKYFKIYGLIIGNSIAVIILTIYFQVKQEKIAVKKPKNFSNILKKNASLIKHILPSTLLNSIAINSIPILIVSLFTLAETGVYFLSLKILSVPLFIISSTISQIYYQKSVRIYQLAKHKLYEFTKRIVLINAVIMLLFLLFINTLGIFLLEYILHQNWQYLRLYIFILSLLMLTKSMFSPISDIVIVLNKTKLNLYFNVFLILINLIAVYVGYLYGNLIYALILISALGSVAYLLFVYYIIGNLKKLATSSNSN